VIARILRLGFHAALIGAIVIPSRGADAAAAALDRSAGERATATPATTSRQSTVATPLLRALPGGLSYLRAKDLAQLDVAATPAEMIIDLRGLRETTPDGARRLGTLLASGSARTLRFVLIDPNTPADLLAIVKASPGRRLTLGANLPAGVVDVAVATPAERDQQAVAALDSGRPLESLLETRQEKVRYDESSMVRDHAKGLPIPDAPPELEPEPGKADANSASTVTAEAPLVDRVLERALHLHRALRAIRRI
jgi:hypothetical protein